MYRLDDVLTEWIEVQERSNLTPIACIAQKFVWDMYASGWMALLDWQLPHTRFYMYMVYSESELQVTVHSMW